MELLEGIVEVDDVDAFVTTLQDVAEECDAAIQAFDARYVVGREHLERAVELATRGANRGETIARNESIEILLYAAGRRQIDDALQMGVSGGRTPAAIVIVGGDEDNAGSKVRERLGSRFKSVDTVGGYDPERVQEFFEIGDEELGAVDGSLEDLVCERVALLVVDQ